MQKPNKTNLIYTSAGIFVGFLTCLILFPTQNTQNIKESRDNDSTYSYINPLLECDNGAYVSQDKNLNNLRKEVKNTIDSEVSKGDISFASIYYRDLNNGPWFGINEKEYFSPASLIKVPLMMAYFKYAEKDPTILEKEIINDEPFDPEEQNIKPEITIEPNKKYKVYDLIERMIIYSDNDAYQVLLKNIDNALVFNVYSDLGVDISKAQTDPSGNIVTVKDYSSFFRILFNSSYLQKQYSEKALEILSRSKYKDGLVNSIPKNIQVAHKFGERQYADTGEKQLHDCGIVYAETKPYLICIMTRAKNFEKASKAIDQISFQIYKEIAKK